jgi:hypothetical protein
MHVYYIKKIYQVTDTQADRDTDRYRIIYVWIFYLEPVSVLHNIIYNNIIKFMVVYIYLSIHTAAAQSSSKKCTHVSQHRTV